MSQYRRCFEVVDSPWRVWDKYAVVQDSSIPPPLLADDFITLEVFTSKVCTCRVCIRRANRLKYKLAPSELESIANTISLLHDFLSAPLSRQPAPAAVRLKGARLNRRDATRESRSRSQISFNAETQRARRNAEEKSFFFFLSLRPSAPSAPLR